VQEAEDLVHGYWHRLDPLRRRRTSLSALQRDTAAVRDLPLRPARHQRANSIAATTDNALAA
jgi:hypothetical protein